MFPIRVRTFARLALFTLCLAVTANLLLVTSASAEDWFIGKDVGLCRGTHIYRGDNESYGYHTIVPVNDWTVRIIGGPHGDWWDTSRKAAGDPSGGTGWVKKSEAESCKNSSAPTTLSTPPFPSLASGIALSKSDARSGESIEAVFSVTNFGEQEWRLQRLGVAVEGPSYLDFGWRENLTIRSGDIYTFQGTVPNAPSTAGTYRVHVSWQDEQGNWNSLGGNNSFRVSSQSNSGSTSNVSNSSDQVPYTQQGNQVQHTQQGNQPPKSQTVPKAPSAVNGPSQPVQPQIRFYADQVAVKSGSCTTLRWAVSGVRAVYLNGKGVNGNGSQYVCPASTAVYILRIVLANGEMEKRITISTIRSTPLDLGPSGVSGDSAKLKQDALAKARERFTKENFDKLMRYLDIAADSAECLVDVVETAARYRGNGVIQPPPEMATHCAKAADGLYRLIVENYDALRAGASTVATSVSGAGSSIANSRLFRVAVDCFPVIGGKTKLVKLVNAYSTASEIKDLLTKKDKIPSLLKLSTTGIEEATPVSCVLTIDENMEATFWLMNTSHAGLWWAAGEFERLWPAWNNFWNSAPVINEWPFR